MNYFVLFVTSTQKLANMTEILYKELSYVIIGAAMEVHRLLGSGYLEAVYQAALAHELCLRSIQYKQFVQLPVKYKGILVGDYEADFVIEDKIVLELKAAAALHPKHHAQAGNYLTTSGLRLAILLNFGADELQSKRVVR